ncbi:hypothetical protein FOC4_g10006037, partial [Fusarium odoratissimum]
LSQGRGSIMNDDGMETGQWDYVVAPLKPAFLIHCRGSNLPRRRSDGRRACL